MGWNWWSNFTLFSVFATLLLLSLRVSPELKSRQVDETPLRYYLPLIDGYRKTYIYFPTILGPPLITTGWPETGAENQSVNLDLTWEGSPNQVNGPLIYEVYLAENNPLPAQPLIRTERTYYTPDTLELNTRYYWQVVALDSQNNRYPSPIFTFTTESAAYPPAIGTSVYVPAGEFLMGCDSGNPAEIPCYPEEVPLHRVYLDAYTIDKYEVTNLEYLSCVQSGACNAPRLNRSRRVMNYYNNPTYNYYPVLYVSWWDAQNYCAWVGKRLPTEAEWEKAARGMSSTRVFPWGNQPNDCTRANKLADNSSCVRPNDTLPVGYYPRGASPYGVMDMAGNAFEWVQDLYDTRYYYSSPYLNPPGSDHVDHDWIPTYNDVLFVIRGGSNVDNWYYMRTAHRHYGHHSEPQTELFDAPQFRSWRVGFRCAASAN